MIPIRASLLALALLGSAGMTPAAAQTGDVLACGRNGTVAAARVNITFYTGANEARWDSGWQSITSGTQFCQRRSDVRAMNVTVEILGFNGWQKICNVNRRPGQSLVASAQVHSNLMTNCEVE